MSANRWKLSNTKQQSLSEEEGAKRAMLSLLNKLTPEKWERLMPQFLAVTVTRVATLRAIVERIFSKAVMEKAFAGMYAELCSQLAGSMPDVHDEDSGDGKAFSFKMLLLERCSAALMEAADEDECDAPEGEGLCEGGDSGEGPCHQEREGRGALFRNGGEEHTLGW